MTCSVTVLYPNDPDLQFNLAYYIKTHMPLVQKAWAPYGMRSWNVIQNQNHPDGSSPRYAVQATLVFDTAEQVKAAVVAEESKVVFGDLENFSNRQALFIVRNVVAEEVCAV